MKAPNKIIEITGLSKVYRLSKETEIKALDKVSLTVEDGEFLAVMGASGSGKSTLLHIIGGVDLAGCSHGRDYFLG